MSTIENSVKIKKSLIGEFTTASDSRISKTMLTQILGNQSNSLQRKVTIYYTRSCLQQTVASHNGTCIIEAVVACEN